MGNPPNRSWHDRVIPPEKVMARLEPGMTIFIGTGVAEPRTLVQHLMASSADNLQDLELIQLVSLGDAIRVESLQSQKFRLKTFFSGWVASDAITAGRVDLIPSRFSRIPRLIGTGRIGVDAVFLQVSPPDQAGYCSLGVAVDAGRQAMARAQMVVGEINPAMPMTFGDTLVHIDEFDLLVAAEHPPFLFDRWPVDPVFDRVAANVAAVIEDGSCLGFSIGPLYEALARHLSRRRHLGIHSPFFTDALMALIQSGAVTNRRKGVFLGKSIASYAFGTRMLMDWLDRNPLVEFQGIDQVFDPRQVGRNPDFIAVFPARRVDLSGRIALHVGKGNVVGRPGEVMDFFNGAEMSAGGRVIFALPSRNRHGASNIRVSVEALPNQVPMCEAVDMVVTECGVAPLSGRTVRERAQALIDIAHPEDRAELVSRAKAARILYPDQIYLSESAHLYPAEIATEHTFKGNLRVRFRAIRPSDEEEMRRLFYRFSDQAVYYRYFAPLKTMPHSRMQQYVNIDYRSALSVVALVGPRGQGRIIAEARYVLEAERAWAEVAFVVDGDYEGLGIATYMYRMLIRLARQRGVHGFTADVLASNKAMMKVFEKGGTPVQARLEQGVYTLKIPFQEAAE
jgi:acyl-CoA hydrolase/RimJ/RimL family protein N-acetyltransferase